MAARPIDRRSFLVLGAGGLVALAACSSSSGSSTPATIGADDARVVEAEDARRTAGSATARYSLVAAPMTLQLGPRSVPTWGYDSIVPGTAVRLTEGDTLEVSLRNDLPEDTTIHWHGLALRNDMDGVHDLTQPAVAPGASFTYRFVAAHPGTYWFHPHMGLQLDRGLYAPLVVAERDDPGAYDLDEVIVLDDWLDGIGTTPEETFQGLSSMGSMDSMGGMDHGGMGGAGGMSMGGSGGMAMFRSDALGGDAGDVAHPLHLINGRPQSDRATLTVPAGGRARLRIINAGSDTAYRVALGGHTMTVTHTDGFPVEPVETDTLIVGMGERYDVLVSPRSGAWPLVAAAEGKDAIVSAVVRTSDASQASAPDASIRPGELEGRMLGYGQLRAGEAVRLDGRSPDVEHRISLQGSMMPYQWSFDGATVADHPPLLVEQGQRARLTFTNDSAMWHPVHLHGHTFRIGTDPAGPRKDTFNLLPGETVSVDFDADNPGRWMLHCHNTYHLEQGMAAVVAYGSQG